MSGEPGFCDFPLGVTPTSSGSGGQGAWVSGSQGTVHSEREFWADSQCTAQIHKKHPGLSEKGVYLLVHKLYPQGQASVILTEV